MPLDTWLALADRPGHIAGHGPADAGTCRDLADAMTGRPGTTYCLTVTTPDGHPLGHACTTTPPPRAGPPPGPESPGPAPPGSESSGSGPPGSESSGSVSSGSGPAGSEFPAPPRQVRAASGGQHGGGVDHWPADRMAEHRDLRPLPPDRGLPARPAAEPPHQDPQPDLHRAGLPPPRPALRPRPRHPLPPRRPDLRMQPAPTLPPTPPVQRHPRLATRHARTRHPDLAAPPRPHLHHHDPSPTPSNQTASAGERASLEPLAEDRRHRSTRDGPRWGTSSPITGAPGISPATSSPPDVWASASSKSCSSDKPPKSVCGATQSRFRRLPPGT